MALKVSSLHFYPVDNAKRHHTERYEIIHTEPRVPVLRRGQEFNMLIQFANRNYINGKDQIRISFKTGPGNPIKGTLGVIKLNEKDIILNNDTWNGKITQHERNAVVVELITPCTAAVGPYEVIVDTVNGAHKENYVYDGDFWLLFNPWVKEDSVYMPETDKLDEYILSDVGKIWVGPYGTTRGREWVFGQFDKVILPACILMLDRAQVEHENRGDPVTMTRAISRIVNSNDDYGVLVGRWDGDYKEGTAPSAWTGSIDILDQFLHTEKEVNYGQCWVFAGVVTTACRALGIPSRVVSNLCSAHDSNGSLTVDKYYDKDNNEMTFDPFNPEGEDSVWNYHVWNDVYMKRPDLPKGYGGWQCIDATPQEKSNNFYQCGPASLEAIRQGEVGLNYDVPFMVASVNADFMKWKQDETATIGYRRIDTNQYHIGRMILTKKPFIFDPNGDQDREDITLEYKPPEGTKGERLSLYNAVQKTTRAKRFYEMPETTPDDVQFTLTDLEKVDIGKPFTVVLQLVNKSKETRTVEVLITAASVYYNGIKAKTIKRSSGDVELKPNTSQDVRMTVTADDYVEDLVEYANMKINSICTVRETKQTWSGEDDFQVLKPPITITGPKEMDVNKASIITLSFKNPIQKTLTRCQFNLSGPGILKHTVKIPFKDCRPNDTLRVQASVTPWNPGNFKLVATFTSKELTDITGSSVVDVY